MTELSEAETLAGPSEPAAPARTRSVALEPGSAVGRYVILNRLGVGGMGVVFAAYDPELDRKIAIKLLHRVAPDAAQEVEARLIREAQAIAKLHDPNVITVHDVGIHERRVFVAMEFVDGGDLGEWMAGDRPRPWREVVERFMAAGRGLAAAHRAGLVHRDFKPANVLLGGDGRVVVADFGLARESGGEVEPIEQVEQAEQAEPAEPATPAAFDPSKLEPTLRSTGRLSGSDRLTRTGSMVGTPAYMAPEQYAGAVVDARADQFSFCVALYEALYGERPFAGDNLHALMLQIHQGKLREPKPGAKVPSWLRKVVARGLARDPDQRWPSMDALLDALTRDPGQRLRRWAALASLAVALAAAGAAVALDERDGGPALCTGVEQAFADTWTGEDRARVAARFAALDGGQDPLARLLPAIDDWADRWRAGWRDACEAHRIRGEQSEQLLDLRMFCLERRRRQVATYVELLGEADEALAGEALDHFEALAELDGCADPVALLADVAPPEDPDQRRRVEALTAELDELTALVETHELDASEARLAALEPRIAAEGWRPLTAELRYFRGRVAAARHDEPLAEREYRAALADSLAVGDERLAIACIDRLANLLAEWQTRYTEAFDLLAIGLALTEQLDDARLRAELLRNEGNVHELRGDYEAAQRSAERALELVLGVSEPDAPEVGRARYSLAMAEYRNGRVPEALAELDRAKAIIVPRYGPNHHQTFQLLNASGLMHLAVGEPAKAVEAFATAASRREALLGPDHLDLSDSLANLGIAQSAAGDHQAARASHERALAIRERAIGPDHLYIGHTLGNLVTTLVALEDYEAAQEAAQRALTIIRAARGDDHVEVEIALTLVALVELNSGELDEAQAHAEQAHALAVRVAGPHSRFTTELLLVEIALARGRPDDALARLTALDGWIGELTLPPSEEVELAVLRAQTFAALGRRAEARAAAEAGLRTYETVDASARAGIEDELASLRELAASE